MMFYGNISFAIERLHNGCWIIGWLDGTNDCGFMPKDRSGFEKYEDAERYALRHLRKMLRARSAEWAEKAKDKATT